MSCTSCTVQRLLFAVQTNVGETTGRRSEEAQRVLTERYTAAEAHVPPPTQATRDEDSKGNGERQERHKEVVVVGGGRSNQEQGRQEEQG